ncbi:MAG: hypothetical protein ACE5JG_07630, partial [Planctomycetota bacterium]
MAGQPERKTKAIAQRIDPGYFARPHRLRTWRRIANWAVPAAAAAWIALLAAAGEERVYASGPLSRRHLKWESDCVACHTVGFGPVLDETCLACHEVAAHTGEGRESDPSCRSCHVEHRGRLALAVVDDAHCNGCHAEHDDIRRLSDHGPFARPDLKQHLEFNHAAHLEPDLKEGPLECASCHAPDASAATFESIRYEAHCARCHTLGFDVDLPGLRAPHGLQLDELGKRITAEYVAALRDDPSLRERSGRVSPVPGRAPDRPPAWTEAVGRRTAAALRVLLPPAGNSGCLQCHVTKNGEILKPAIPRHWLRKARFDHGAHRFESCASCHDMSANESAAQLARPEIESCRSCHRPGGA